MKHDPKAISALARQILSPKPSASAFPHSIENFRCARGRYGMPSCRSATCDHACANSAKSRLGNGFSFLLSVRRILDNAAF